MALSHDHSKIIAGFEDRRVRLFDSASGEEIGDPIIRAVLKCGARSVAYSQDDSRIATIARCPDSLRLFNAEEGSELISPIETGVFDMDGISFSPDDRFILINGGQYKGIGQVRLLDAATGQDVIEPIAHENTVRKATFSEDGSRFFTLSGPKYRRFNVSKGP